MIVPYNIAQINTHVMCMMCVCECVCFFMIACKKKVFKVRSHKYLEQAPLELITNMYEIRGISMEFTDTRLTLDDTIYWASITPSY